MTNNIKIAAIGDIHGHYREYLEIIDKLETVHHFDFTKDIVVHLGDYVDGGPDTYSVIDQLMYFKKTYPHWKFLYGNHEDLMLDALNPQHPVYHDFDLWWNQGGEDTFDSYLRHMGLNEYESKIVSPQQAILQSHIDFLSKLDTFYETDKYFFVHGGIQPNMSIEDNLNTMSRYDMIWMREPFISSKWNWGKKIIFGHTIDGNGRYHPTGKILQPIKKKNKIGLDTFAHNMGYLSAVILPEERFIKTDWTDDATKPNEI